MNISFPPNVSSSSNTPSFEGDEFVKTAASLGIKGTKRVAQDSLEELNSGLKAVSLSNKEVVYFTKPEFELITKTQQAFQKAHSSSVSSEDDSSDSEASNSTTPLATTLSRTASNDEHTTQTSHSTSPNYDSDIEGVVEEPPTPAANPKVENHKTVLGLKSMIDDIKQHRKQIIADKKIPDEGSLKRFGMDKGKIQEEIKYLEGFLKEHTSSTSNKELSDTIQWYATALKSEYESFLYLLDRPELLKKDDK